MTLASSAEAEAVILVPDDAGPCSNRLGYRPGTQANGQSPSTKRFSAKKLTWRRPSRSSRRSRRAWRSRGPERVRGSSRRWRKIHSRLHVERYAVLRRENVLEGCQPELTELQKQILGLL